MKISFLIVTRNRPDELRFTLGQLYKIIDLQVHEVLVFIDGCSLTQPLIEEFSWVKWSNSDQQLSASPARQLLYRKAIGTIFIGLDDDAHPLSTGFIEAVASRFRESENLAIIAFQEVRGLFDSDEQALSMVKKGEPFLVNEFIGCGFAITKEAYHKTQGFPLWMDIYGEETAVATEVLNQGYDILYDYNIVVNHRVDVEKRKLQKRNYFRFEKQLVNVLKYYAVYHKRPFYPIARAAFHNLKKYAFKDLTFFKKYLKAMFTFNTSLPKLLKYRKPVKEDTIKRMRSLKSPFYN